jgi:hypothetical protein
VLLWKDCGSNVWSLRAKGGRIDTFKHITAGKIIADAPFSQVSAFNLAGSDTLDNSGITEIDFSVGVWYANDRGFNFSTAGQTQSCFDLTTQEIPTLIVGGSKKKGTVPFDLVTLEACIPLPPADPECGDPQVSGPDDFGVFVWKNCGYQGPESRWNVTIGGGGSSWAGYAGVIESDGVISATGVDLEPNDTLDSTPGDEQVDFVLFVGGTGIDGFQIDVPAASTTCFAPEFFSSGQTYYLGAERAPITGNFDMLTLAACELEPPPPAEPGCGDPNFNATSENAVFVWRDCDAPGNDQQWKLRVAGGGANWGPYEGNITSLAATLSATGFSLEGSDVLDSAPGDGFVDFELRVGGSGQDGFDITIPEGADACLDVTLVQNGAPVLLGQDRDVMTGRFDLTTLGACN